MPDSPSYVVTGGAHGVGRAIVDRLAHSGHVVVIDVAEEPDRRDERVSLITGDARDSDVAVKAARAAEGSGVLSGWVNNAAVFSDATLVLASPSEILDLITANLALCRERVPHSREPLEAIARHVENHTPLARW
jgi:NAD(P)-dependent dehydrogenase (short-subunit alcohol dehydrogenase family)